VLGGGRGGAQAGARVPLRGQVRGRVRGPGGVYSGQGSCSRQGGDQVHMVTFLSNMAGVIIEDTVALLWGGGWFADASLEEKLEKEDKDLTKKEERQQKHKKRKGRKK
jgi:hypothetical protein